MTMVKIVIEGFSITLHFNLFFLEQNFVAAHLSLSYILLMGYVLTHIAIRNVTRQKILLNSKSKLMVSPNSCIQRDFPFAEFQLLIWLF